MINGYSNVGEKALFALPSDDQWKKHRKFLQPAFGPSHLKHAQKVTMTSMQELFGIWDSEFVGKKDINLHRHFTLVASDVMYSVLGVTSTGI